MIWTVSNPTLNGGSNTIRPATSSTFLGLPRELRDIIYSSLLEERRLPPDDPEHSGPREPDWKTPCTIYFEAHSPKPALLQLKLVCQQVYSEVTETLMKPAVSVSGPAHLDVMIRDYYIWPTWLFLPLTTSLHPTVRISLRLCDAKGWGSEFSTGAYRGLWPLINLLVFRGPCLNHNKNGLATPLLIHRLRFDIAMCFPTSVDDLFGTYRDVFDRLEKLASARVGHGNVHKLEARLGTDKRVWRLKRRSPLVRRP